MSILQILVMKVISDILRKEIINILTDRNWLIYARA